MSSKNFKVPYVYEMTTMVCKDEDDDNSMQTFTFACNHDSKGSATSDRSHSVTSAAKSSAAFIITVAV